MSEARSEHEWSSGSDNFKVSWGRLFKGLTNEVRYEGWLMSIQSQGGMWMRQDGDLIHAAAEIARLRGLVPPGGEEEKG